MTELRKTFYDKEGNRAVLSMRFDLDCFSANLRERIELYALKQMLDYAEYKQLMIFKPQKKSLDKIIIAD